MSRVEPSTSLPVVLVHGVGVSSLYLLPTLRALAPTFRCYAPDLPGFGRTHSDRTLSTFELARALRRWLEVNAIGPAVFVANSMGCQFVAELAAAHPERVRALVLVGPTMDPAHPTLFRQLFAGLRTAPYERPALFPILALDYLRSGARRILATMRDGLAHPLERLAPRIQAPVLLVRGTRDRIAGSRWLSRLASAFPHARVARVPGAAHAVNFSAPLELSRLVTLFLEDMGRMAAELPSSRRGNVHSPTST